ncbi:MAG: hypothetical protein UY89_C0037G0007 [Parcubacteria group bacterium GW2011_GWA1_54_9]|nr:MAG: hypothetical protein UY89_C0037G0007 [Parcubacteria group bacterium GW2011_GWA1_54_9]
MHPLFILAIVVILASLGFSKLLAIPLIFGFALFLYCVPVAIGIVVTRHYVRESLSSGNWWPS